MVGAMRSILLALVGLVALTAVAEAKQVRYVGIHPAAKSEGGGICYIEAPHVHVYPLFIRPAELRAMAFAAGLRVMETQGVRVVPDRAFWWSVWHRRIHPDFAFTYTRSHAVGYAGYAVRERR